MSNGTEHHSMQRLMHLEWRLGVKTMKDPQVFSATSSIFSIVLSNATLCNVPSLD